MNYKIAALVLLFLVISPASSHKIYVRKIQINEQEKESVYECLRNQLSRATLSGTFATFSSFILAKMGLWMAGFSSIGPVAGSLAAWLQSTIGNVAAGSIFAYLQSLAMGQLSLLLGPTVVVGSITAIIYLMFSCINVTMLVEEKEVNEEHQQGSWGQTFSNFYNNYIGNSYEILAALTNARDFLYDVIKFIVYFIQQEYLKFQKKQD